MHMASPRSLGIGSRVGSDLADQKKSIPNGHIIDFFNYMDMYTLHASQYIMHLTEENGARSYGGCGQQYIIVWNHDWDTAEACGKPLPPPTLLNNICW